MSSSTRCVRQLGAACSRRTAAARPAGSRCRGRVAGARGAPAALAGHARGLAGRKMWERRAAAEEASELENVEVVDAGDEDFDEADFEEVLYSLDKSASVSSLLDALEQNLGSQLNPEYAPDQFVEQDYEKQADALRSEMKSKGVEERLIEIRRVTKVVKGGNILSFRAIVAIGDKKGNVGVGVGKGREVMPATTKAVADAKRNMVKFPFGRNESIPHTVVGEATSARVLMRPATEGTGVIAGGATRTVLELAGVNNVLTKQLGGQSLLNNARATIKALRSLRSPQEVAKKRGKTVRQLYGLDMPTKVVETIDVGEDRMEELLAKCDAKTRRDIAEAADFLKEKGAAFEPKEAKVVETKA